MDGHDQLAILKGGLQQFGIAIVLQVGDKEVVVVCLLGLDVVGQVESDLQALLREVFLGDFLTDGAVLVLDPQRNFVEFGLAILGGLFLGDLLFQGGLDLLGSGEALILQLLGDVVGGQFLLDDLGLDRCSRGGGVAGGLGCRGRVAVGAVVGAGVSVGLAWWGQVSRSASRSGPGSPSVSQSAQALLWARSWEPGSR